MKDFDRRKHWKKIYQSKLLNECSWYQPFPETSFYFIKQLHVPLNAKIIDVGGGDSLLADCLLDQGYFDITVLDIAETSIERAKQRLGEKAKMIKWIIADITDFNPTEKYDFWHDRAAFHFLTTENEIDGYIRNAYHNINQDGMMVLGTFSEQGPKTCSGLEVQQYSEKTMTSLVKMYFRKIRCLTTDHKTPSGSIQNFIFCSFRRSN